MDCNILSLLVQKSSLECTRSRRATHGSKGLMLRKVRLDVEGRRGLMKGKERYVVEH